ncbi:hypothetical protein FA13DRAFT_1717064 [Coprinellus micaceus]|uniref:Uncharacterized protein n=1 Tax=Coprinellus micaceus TaxID=71717 RepID=A0A4Y7SIC0_COPMI|nr:hypothetical protein FA13DRAFT_1717064 [Coprinellus micaceus]
MSRTRGEDDGRGWGAPANARDVKCSKSMLVPSIPKLCPMGPPRRLKGFKGLKLKHHDVKDQALCYRHPRSTLSSKHTSFFAQSHSGADSSISSAVLEAEQELALWERFFEDGASLRYREGAAEVMKTRFDGLCLEDVVLSTDLIESDSPNCFSGIIWINSTKGRSRLAAHLGKGRRNFASIEGHGTRLLWVL